jgi:hypothetical protein
MSCSQRGAGRPLADVSVQLLRYVYDDSDSGT